MFRRISHLARYDGLIQFVIKIFYCRLTARSINFCDYQLDELFIFEWGYSHSFKIEYILTLCILYDDKLRTSEIEWPWKQACTECCYNRVPSVYATLIEKQSAGVFAQYFYDIFGVPGSVLGVQPYKHRLTVHLPTDRAVHALNILKHERSYDPAMGQLRWSMCTCVKTQSVVVNFETGCEFLLQLKTAASHGYSSRREFSLFFFSFACYATPE